MFEHQKAMKAESGDSWLEVIRWELNRIIWRPLSYHAGDLWRRWVLGIMYDTSEELEDKRCRACEHSDKEGACTVSGICGKCHDYDYDWDGKCEETCKKNKIPCPHPEPIEPNGYRKWRPW